MSIDLAHSLIKERELNEGNLEKAEKILWELTSTQSSSRGYGLLAEIQYWKGEIAAKDQKIPIYEKGIEFGKKGVALDQDNIESNFWLGVCYGLLGEEQGIMSSFFLLEPIETCFNHSLKLDESYFYGAPLRSIGLFYHRIPGWPVSKGDNRKALSYLEKSLQYGPEFYLNHLYISWVYKALGDTSRFRYHLEWIIDAHPTRKFANENNRHKEHARKLLRT
jgi:tetratricopeptide (TPR) repeat protein